MENRKSTNVTVIGVIISLLISIILTIIIIGLSIHEKVFNIEQAINEAKSTQDSQYVITCDCSRYVKHTLTVEDRNPSICYSSDGKCRKYNPIPIVTKIVAGADSTSVSPVYDIINYPKVIVTVRNLSDTHKIDSAYLYASADAVNWVLIGIRSEIDPNTEREFTINNVNIYKYVEVRVSSEVKPNDDLYVITTLTADNGCCI